MKNYRLFALLLALQVLALVVYTILAFRNEGPNLAGIFLSGILSMGWNGQFNLDFSCYLLLSALWIVWRNGFSAKSFAVAAAAMIIGYMFFAPYLLYLLAAEKGNLKKVLTGNR